MVTIESDISEIKATSEKVFVHLCNMNNWQALMPEQVTKWTSSENNCSFLLNGMATIGLKISASTANSLITIHSEGKAPFTFELQLQIREITSETSTVQIIFNGDMNPMIRMMAEKPLTNFFNYLSHKMRGIS